MTYSVHQHWDPLKVCAVGRSYNPEFYSFITNSRVRNVMERIAIETEEDYQKLIKLLELFGVKIFRPQVSDNFEFYSKNGRENKILPPPMTPRDYSIMLGEDFFFSSRQVLADDLWKKLRGDDWPISPPNLSEIKKLPKFILEELKNNFGLLDQNFDPIKKLGTIEQFTWGDMLSSMDVKKIHTYVDHEKMVGFNSAMTTRVGKDIYLGTNSYGQDQSGQVEWLKKNFPQYRYHIVDTGGHGDGVYCPVKPGLIVSLRDVPTYAKTFPGWEVVYLPGQSWAKVQPFLNLKVKNKGKWWVPGEELNNDFTEFVEGWLSHWVGYVEETVFDVNMLVIDEKNVLCNNYNQKVFDAFAKRGITAHVINFRHRYFWDGGWHCVTSDLHRDGTQKDYFPERG